MNKENTKGVDVNKVAYALSLTEKMPLQKIFALMSFAVTKVNL
jgi:hypothetical protein